MTALRFGLFAIPLALAACHTPPIIVGNDTGGQKTSSGTTGGSTGTTTGGTTGTTTGGSSTGTIVVPLTPSFLLDAGEGEVFGPLALANGATGIGYSGGRLAYTDGDGGQFGVFLVSLAGDGTPLAGPNLIAVARSGSIATDGGPELVASPPHVTIASFENGTAICWEDFGAASNPFESGCTGASGPIVLCDTLDEQGDDPQSSYAACGALPRLVFNPTDLITQLFFTDGAWTYGQPENDSISGQDSWGTSSFAGVPISSGQDAVLLPGETAPAAMPRDGGLLLVPVPYGSFGYGLSNPPEAFNLDPSFTVDGQFAAASNFGSQTLSVLELDEAGLRTAAWQFDAGVREVVPIPYPQPTVGPIAVGTCPKGFGYLAMTDAGSVLFAEEAFGGDFLPGSGTLVALPGFTSPVTSLAIATQPGGGLFLAVSGPAQLGVYFIQGCE